MKLTLESLKVLDAIERTGSFASAAQLLHRVPSALSYTIHKLESDLNIQIFNRDGHRAKLTPMGQLVLQEGRKLLLAAERLENSIKLKQSGWEDHLVVAYDQLIPLKNLIPLIQDFYQECPGVSLKLTSEVLGGCWDALTSEHVNIAIGVSGEAPIIDDIEVLSFGEIDFVYVVAPHHPLATRVDRIPGEELKKHRIIAVADSSRISLPRSSGLLPDQEILTVSNFEEKEDALVAGLGIGYLPKIRATPYVKSGQLIIKDVEKTKSKGHFSIAWRPSKMGHAGSWIIHYLRNSSACQRILQPTS